MNFSTFLIISGVIIQVFGQNVIKLPSMAQVAQIGPTISGFSSGGTMASQIHVSHSSLFTGVGMLASVYYRCGQGRGGLYYLNQCQKGNVPVQTTISDAKGYETQGKIDSLSNISRHKIYIWLGTEDEFVNPDVRMRSRDFYKAFTPESNIQMFVENANHEFPTDKYGPPCPEPTDNFIGNCNYSGSYETLSFLHGKDRIYYPTANALQPLLKFDQTEFTSGQRARSIGIDDTGLLYVPSRCQPNSGNKCLLHFFLHGCAFGRADKIEDWIRLTGYIEMAEQNDIIMIFPRATTVPFTNPNGCWDMTGFTSQDYANKEGIQIKTIKNMADRIFGKF